MELGEAIRRRRMVRNFEDRPVPAEALERILDHARRAPSAGYTQGTVLLVLEGPEQVGRFWDCTFPAEQRGEFRWSGLFRAPVIILPCASKEAYLDRYAEPDKGWTDRDEGRWPVPYWDIDCGMATMAILLSAVDEGLGALFFGIFDGLPALRAEFGIAEEYHPIGAVALGWPAPDEPSPSLRGGGARPKTSSIAAAGERISAVAKGTILVVDDEANIADLVDMYLRKEGFRVLKAGTGEDGLEAARRERPRLVVLDVGLPGIDGLEVCRRLRSDHPPGDSGPGIPVIFLTARDSEIDRILGLEMGADDYLTKPFSPRELVARVKAILRRTESSAPAPEVIEVGGAVIDLGRREVRANGAVVDCTGKEFELLRYLAENRGRALSRQQILDGVWGYGWYGDARTVDVHVAQVRKKLGDAVAITTVRGVGYRLDPP